jgi:environmental stress-induced protein Ves
VSHEPNHSLNRATKGLGQILGPSDYTTSAWSAGSTTELVSSPAGADFSSRQFLWRVSIATVGKDGAFTRFENIQRILMVLKGGIHLTHEGEYDCALLAFEQDKLSGNFQTFAKIKQGGATNLNLMLKEGSAGEMLHIALEAGQSHRWLMALQAVRKRILFRKPLTYFTAWMARHKYVIQILHKNFVFTQKSRSFLAEIVPAVTGKY